MNKEQEDRRGPVEHVTHVERNSAGRFYFWCENPDCLARTGHYLYEQDAYEAGRRHERVGGASDA